eukprot:TRINITY_DN4395_c0_g1_i2.p1 TRINITY_DN4395_c0_g1~~TRINITY_DN4395_c0_g1_i2.p1  ORF type:complete len:782 (+),score=222.33 TRINITY_DN4395_c0_g1_i2:138-2483(+)
MAKAALSQNEIKAIFYALDADSSGALSIEELEDVFKYIGIDDPEIIKQQVPALMKELDADNDGEVTLHEFLDGCHRVGLAVESADHYAHRRLSSLQCVAQDQRNSFVTEAGMLFDKLDQDGSGSLDRSEIAGLMRGLAPDTAEQELQILISHMMSLLDTDGDGRVTQHEFVAAAQDGHLDGLIELSLRAGGEGSQPEIVLSNRMPAETKKGLQQRLKERQAPERNEATKNIEEEQYTYLWQMFNVADDDGSGEIDLAELTELLTDMTVVGSDVARLMNSHRVQDVLEMIDDDHSGKLDFHEFCVAFDELLHRKGTPRGVLGALATSMAVEASEFEEELATLKRMFRKERAEAKHMRQDLLERFQQESDHQQHLIEELTTQLRAAEDKRKAKDAHIADLERIHESQEAEIAELKQTQRQDHIKAQDGHVHEVYGYAAEQEIKELRQELVSQAEHHEEDIHRFVKQLAVVELQLATYSDTIILLQELQSDHAHGFSVLLSEDEQAQVLEAQQSRKSQATHSHVELDGDDEHDGNIEASQLRLDLQQRELELANMQSECDKLQSELVKAKDGAIKQHLEDLSLVKKEKMNAIKTRIAFDHQLHDLEAHLDHMAELYDANVQQACVIDEQKLKISELTQALEDQLTAHNDKQHNESIGNHTTPAWFKQEIETLKLEHSRQSVMAKVAYCQRLMEQRVKHVAIIEALKERQQLRMRGEPDTKQDKEQDKENDSVHASITTLDNDTCESVEAEVGSNDTDQDDAEQDCIPDDVRASWKHGLSTPVLV